MKKTKLSFAVLLASIFATNVAVSNIMPVVTDPPIPIGNAPIVPEGQMLQPPPPFPQPNMNGGFVGPTNAVTTVKDALQVNFFNYNDPLAELTGHIVKSMGGNKYLFRDPTGRIVVEINRRIWRGLTITPETKITIYGEVDEDFSANIIDVKRIELAL